MSDLATNSSPLRPGQLRLPRLLYRYRVWLFLWIAGAYLAGYTGRFHMSSDAALYAEVGRNLAEGKGYTYHGQPDTLLYPGLPYLHALSRTLSTEHHGLISHAILLAMGLGTIALSYRIYLFYLRRELAVLALMLTAGSFLVYEYSFNLMTDMPYTLGVTLALLGYLRLIVPRPRVESAMSEASSSFSADSTGHTSPRRRAGRALPWIALIVGLALAVVMRPTMMALVLTLLLGGGVYAIRGPYRLRALAVIAVTLAMLAAFYTFDIRRADAGELYYEAGLVKRVVSPGDTLLAALFDSMPRMFGYLFAEAVFAVDMSMPANAVTTFLALVFLVVGCWRRWVWALFVAINLGAMLMLSAEPPRYLLPMLPIFMIGAVQTYAWIAGRLPRPWGGAIATSLLIFVMGMNAAKNANLLWVQHSEPFYEQFQDGKFVPRLEAAEALREHLAENDTAIAANYRELTYASDRTVIDLNARSERRILPVLMRRWERGDGEWFVIEQRGAPIPKTYLGFELVPQGVVAQSRMGSEGAGFWRLHRVALRLMKQESTEAFGED